MTRDIAAELRQIAWLSPWEPTNVDFAAELAREVGRDHALYGKRAIAVARRVDQDDVLFLLPDGPAPLAVVHLTYAGRERSPEWPSTQLYQSLEDWMERRMRTDHTEQSGTPDERSS
jgi:hypothetical protein